MNVILTIVIKTICSFFGTVAFGKIFNCPKHCLYKAGFVGAVGFGVYIILLSGFGVSSMLSNFAGTVALSLPAGTRNLCLFFPFLASFLLCRGCPFIGP